jgi:hypothetical protein
MHFGRTVSSLGVAFTIIFSGCSQSSQTLPPPPAQPSYISHTVTYQGETLASIAKWYTGSSSNWQTIRDANPELDPRKIRIGTTIQIPRELALRSDAPSKPKAPSIAKKQTPPVVQEGSAPPVADLPDSFATNNNAPQGDALDAQVAVDLPQPPSEDREADNLESQNNPPESTLANETIQPTINEESSYDRASPGLPLGEQPIQNDISNNLPSGADPSAEGELSNESSKNGLVKGILEAVGNAALDSKKGEGAAAPSN